MSQKKITIPLVVSPVSAKGRQPVPLDVDETLRKFLSSAPSEWQSHYSKFELLLDQGASEEDFVEWQRLVSRAMLLPASRWSELQFEFTPKNFEELLKPPTIEFDWGEEVPTARFCPQSGLGEVIAALQFSKLQGAEYRKCARPDCKEPPFRVRNHQNRAFCSPKCAHLVAVRRHRGLTPAGERPKAKKPTKQKGSK